MPLIRLGQTADASSQVTLFTVTPATYSFVTAKSLIVTNRAGTQTAFRVGHVTGGGAVGNADWWFYGTALVPNQTLQFSLDAGLSPTDTVVAHTPGSANVTINLYGEK